MIRFLRATILIAIWICSIVVSPLMAAIPSDIRLLDSAIDGVEFVYTPHGDGPSTFSIDSREYTRFFWDNIAIEGEPGQPAIPVRYILIALPPESTPQVHVMRYVTRSQADIRLAPVSTPYRGEDGVESWRYDENAEAYGTDAATPARPVVVSEPFMYRGYWLAKVSVYPVQYYPASSQVRIAGQVQVRVDFLRQDQSPLRRLAPRVDPIVSEVVINPEQAAVWHAAQSMEVSPPWPAERMVKIIVRQEGIYKISGRDLDLLGIPIGDIDPSRLRLFNNGGRELPRAVDAPRPDSLIENAIYVIDGNDGSFDSDDYLLFYGRGVTGWDQMEDFFQHYIHHYTEDNVYWLQYDFLAPLGKRMGQLGVNQQPTTTVNTTRARFFREDENIIFNWTDWPDTGLNWYMKLFTGNQSASYTFSISDVDATETMRLRCRFKHFGIGSHHVDIYVNNPVTPIHSTNSIGGVIDAVADGTVLNNGTNTLRFDHTTSGSMYLDWFELEYSRSLRAVQNELAFESPQVNGVVRYELEGFSAAQIFNITDPFNVTMADGMELVDSCDADVWRRYFAVDDGEYRSPLSMEIVEIGGDEYGDLRTDLGQNINYIVLSADEFYPTLSAYEDHWEDFRPGLQAIRVRVSDVFNQFGWGLCDPTAIRDFLKYTSEHWTPMPEYVLFVGDGDYDYKNRVSGSGGNWIPSNQDGGKCTDDWFAYFTPNPPAPEMAMGRWPVTSVEETEIVVQKVIQYESEPLYGPWRHRITMVADDEYGDGGGYHNWEENHTRDTEVIAEQYLPRHFNLTKIYLIEYPVQWDAAAVGRRKPQAADDLVKSINDGTLIVNYMGHGNPQVWAHELVFGTERDLPRIDNDAMLSAFVAGTCSWGRFDDPLEQSFPEQLLVAPNRGSIAGIGATRFTTSTANEHLVQDFYSRMFENPFDPKSLGLSMLFGKIQGGADAEKYHVLGDPTVVL
ncbi:hypothetical protein AMJ86_07200, partial [bacterium SM23_57]